MDLYQGVNTLLAAIGEIPITNNTEALAASSTSDVGIARDTLLMMSQSIQAGGYWFNKELGYPMVPNTDGYIPVGNIILSIVSPTLVVKDHRLYDTESRTYIFEDVQEVDIIFNITFDDLPWHAADAIVREAAVEYYNNMLGDSQELRILSTNAQRALIALQKEQARQRKVSLISGSRLLDRRSNPTGVQ